MPTTIKSDIGCPDCRLKGAVNPLMTALGRNEYFCSAGHTYKDLSDLRDMNPDKLEAPKQVAKIPQGGLGELRLMLPSKLIDFLRKRFGERLDASASSLLAMMADPGAFVISGEDAKEMQKWLGQKVTNATVLQGMIFALKTDRDQLQKKVDDKGSGVPETETNAVDGEFVQMALRVPVDYYVQIREKAKFNNMNAAEMIASVLHIALENGWI